MSRNTNASSPIANPFPSKRAARTSTSRYCEHDANGVVSLSTNELRRLAVMFRGEFLEGIDLPDLHDFQAWCLAEREDVRRMQALILSTLVGQLARDPGTALPHARQLVQIDPFNDAARISLLQFLVALGRRDEAEQHFELAVRVFKELGENAELNLVKSWRALRGRTPAPPTDASVPENRAEGAGSNIAATKQAPSADASLIARPYWLVARTNGRDSPRYSMMPWPPGIPG